MLCLTVRTNLHDIYEEPIDLGPYSFTDEEARSDWAADLELVLVDLNDELMGLSDPHRIRMVYEFCEGLYCVAPAPPVDYLIKQLREHGNRNCISLAFEVAIV